jgi:hypothetical protein
MDSTAAAIKLLGCIILSHPARVLEPICPARNRMTLSLYNIPETNESENVITFVTRLSLVPMRLRVNFRPDALNVATRLRGRFPFPPGAVSAPRSGSPAGCARDIPLER